MPPVWINDGGTWREAKQIYVNNGSWVDVTAQWAQDDTGQWRKVFEKGGAGPIPSPFVGTYGFYGYNSSNNSGRIIIADRDAGGTMTEIADFTATIEYTKFSPDGDTLVVVEPSSTGQIRIRHRNVSSYGSVTQSISYGAGNPRPIIVWSEDGLLMLVAYRRSASGPTGWVCGVYTRPTTSTTTLTSLGFFHAGVLEANESIDLNFSISPNKQYLAVWSINASPEYVRIYPYTGSTYSGTPITIPLPPNWDETRSFVWSQDGAVAIMGYREVPASRPGFEYTSTAYSYSISGGIFTLGSEVGSLSSNDFGSGFVGAGAIGAFDLTLLSADNTFYVFRYNSPDADTNFPRWEQVAGTTFQPLPPNTTPIIASSTASFFGSPYYDRSQNTAVIFFMGTGYDTTFEAYTVNGELVVGPTLPAFPTELDAYDLGGRIVAPYDTAPVYGY